MEITEIISSYLNTDGNILEVSFRLMDDDEDVVRNDNIEFSTVKEYGYTLVDETDNLFSEMFDDDDNEEVSSDIDEEELIQFLNEYYVVNPKLLPKTELY